VHVVVIFIDENNIFINENTYFPASGMPCRVTKPIRPINMLAI